MRIQQVLSYKQSLDSAFTHYSCYLEKEKFSKIDCLKYNYEQAVEANELKL